MPRGREGEALVAEAVRPEQIAEVVERWTGIPTTKMLEGEKEKLLKMEEELGKRVVGQRAAVEAVSSAVRRSRAGSERREPAAWGRSCSLAPPASARPN